MAASSQGKPRKETGLEGVGETVAGARGVGSDERVGETEQAEQTTRRIVNRQKGFTFIPENEWDENLSISLYPAIPNSLPFQSMDF
jgi:hypothetical protein